MWPNRLSFLALCAALLAAGMALIVKPVAGAMVRDGAPPPAIGPVLITEFMAAPDDDAPALTDADGDASDWIELFNASAETVDLSNWSLTDSVDQPARWRFPRGTVMAPQSYLVVFASDKNRRMPGAELHTNFKLKREGEYLALVNDQGAVVSGYSPRYPEQYTGLAFGLDRDGAPYSVRTRHFPAPTPGTPNPTGLGPVISGVTHTPVREGAAAGDAPKTGESLLISARIESASADHQVFLRYSFGLAPPVAQAMQAMDDGVYTAVIPSEMQREGELIRYAVTARDGDGPLATWPLPRGPEAPNFLGTVIGYEALDARSALPLFHWYVAEDPTYGTEWYRPGLDAHYADFLEMFPDPDFRPNYNAGTFEDAGIRTALFYRGRYYDNIHVRLRGYWSKNIAKKSVEFNFNRDRSFYLAGDEPDTDRLPVAHPYDEIDMITTGRDAAQRGDASYLHELLGNRTYAAAGAHASVSFPVRINLNGAFFSVSIFVEQPGAAYLIRRGLDPNGTLIKVDYNDLGREHFIFRQDPLSGWKNTDGLEQRLPDPEDDARLDEVVDLIDGLHPDDGLPAHEARRTVTRYLLQRIHLPSTLNYLAARTLIMDWDTVLHNFYLYRAPGERGEWRILPWDKSETFAYSKNPDFLALEPDHPLYGSLALYATAQPDDPGMAFNHLYDAVYQDPALRQMYLRRLRSMMDQLLREPESPTTHGPLTPSEIRRLLDSMSDEIHTHDLAKWGMTFAPESVFSFLDRRRSQLYDASNFDGMIPGVHPAAQGAIRFRSVADGGDGFEPHLALINCTGVAVDLSGWSIRSREARYTFAPGVILPGVQDYLQTLYLAPDAHALLADLQAADPDGLYWALGDLDEGLIDAKGALSLWDAHGTRITTDSRPQADCTYLYAPAIVAP